MPTAAQITEIVEKVRKRLAEGEREGIHLKVVGEELDDDWLYIAVTTSRPGVRLGIRQLYVEGRTRASCRRRRPSVAGSGAGGLISTINPRGRMISVSSYAVDTTPADVGIKTDRGR